MAGRVVEPVDVYKGMPGLPDEKKFDDGAYLYREELYFCRC